MLTACPRSLTLRRRGPDKGPHPPSVFKPRGVSCLEEAGPCLPRGGGTLPVPKGRSLVLLSRPRSPRVHACPLSSSARIGEPFSGFVSKGREVTLPGEASAA